jgi:hypothetical protein
MEDLQSSHVSEINIIREDFLKKGFKMTFFVPTFSKIKYFSLFLFMIERNYVLQIQEYEALKVDFHRTKENVCREKMRFLRLILNQLVCESEKVCVSEIESERVSISFSINILTSAFRREL